MNRKRKIIVVSVISIAALVLTTGWNVLAGDTCPPEPYQVYSAAGAWTHTSDLDQPGDICMVTFSPEDPRTGTGFVVATGINSDPTLGGGFPDATSMTPFFGSYVRTGPNTILYKAVCYVRKDEKPKLIILEIFVIESTSTQTLPDTMEAVGTLRWITSRRQN